MSSPSSPTLQRVVRKFSKQASATAIIEPTDDAPSAALAASEKGHELDARIRTRAYELYEQRGFQEGHELDDWLQAEREVLAAHLVTN